MMTQFRISLLLLLSLGILLKATAALAADDVVVTCNASCSTPGLPLQSLSWAPGASWEERVVVDNQVSLNRTLEGSLVVSGDSSIIAALNASWKNGSHKIIRQGSLSDMAHETALSTVPPNSKRVYYLTVILPKSADNLIRNKNFKLSASLRITDVPKAAKAASSKTPSSKAKTVSSGVLAASASHMTYPLPSLQSRIMESEPLQRAGQLVQAARRQLWWGWLIVAIEVSTLMPWRARIASMWQRLIVEVVSVIAACILSGWLAALAASLWLCVDLGSLSARLTENPFAIKSSFDTTQFVSFLRRQKS